MPMSRPSARRGEAAAPHEFRLAAIDVGSNSIHMVIAQAEGDGSITTLWRMKEMVGLGRISFPSHRLSREAIDRALLTLRHFVHTAHRRHCEKIIAVATSAVREAENGGDFIEQVRRQLGLHIRVVSAKDEARLIYLGVRHAMPLKSGPHLIVDIGGGSVEFIVADETRPLLLESRKLGAARMSARYVHSDPILADDLKSLKRHYDRELTSVCAAITQLRPVKTIGTSGTIENLAALCGTTTRSNGAEHRLIERADLAKLVGRLLESRAKDRAKMRGLDEQRQDQIVAGAVLANELFRRLDLPRLLLCRSALREGILIDYLSRHLPDLAIRRQVPDPRRRSVIDLARRCDWHQTHSLHVAHLTLRLFDQLARLHGLDRHARELIEYGAMLHDIGWHIGPKSHHKHAQYLILHGQLQGFTQEEVGIVSCIARYHRKAAPKLTHEAYANLPSKAQAIVRVGAAVLRLADGLDRSHCGVIRDLRCRNNKRRIDVHLHAWGDAELEIWTARRKMTMFTDVFGGRTLRFHQTRPRRVAPAPSSS
jgi:exopolyphosphatase/guanosine-5'-triphosphate,3'-diphosphate pyrophosphatase